MDDVIKIEPAGMNSSFAILKEGALFTDYLQTGKEHLGQKKHLYLNAPPLLVDQFPDSATCHNVTSHSEFADTESICRSRGQVPNGLFKKKKKNQTPEKFVYF